MRHLLLGYGEVGRAIGKIIGKHQYITRKKSTWDGKGVNVLHVCIPYSNAFIKTVKSVRKYADLVIVHSSVPVGTCDRLGIVHSPVRGVHPNLTRGIMTFVKYFGGRRAKEASLIFRKKGIWTRVCKNARITEALKLWDTSQYGRLIMLEKEIYRW